MFLLPVSRYECERTPAVTIGFVVSISLLWFCLWATSYPQSVFAELGFIASQPNPLSLLSSLFLHHGILYLLPNAMFLFIFGKQVEDAFGHLLLHRWLRRAAGGETLRHMGLRSSSSKAILSGCGTFTFAITSARR
jgi:hypothetical protein